MLAAKAATTRDARRVTIVPSPSRDQQWRIIATPGASAVERSVDAGQTWAPQPLNASVVVTAGASPSPTVCWLVGPRGTVLLTRDARTWQSLPFPEAIDLINVRATDDRSATVTALDGRVFSTTDRGVTWTR
jgi:photosystem II stability/assembly factor-like uncharacterized protein